VGRVRVPVGRGAAVIARLLGGLCAALALAAGVQTWRLHSARADVDRLQSEASTFAGLRALDAAALTALRDANKRLADAARADETAAAAAAERLQAERDRLAAALDRERKRRADLYRSDTDAKNWADAAVPAAVARSLQGAD
jgi:hypothetical protein